MEVERRRLGSGDDRLEIEVPASPWLLSEVRRTLADLPIPATELEVARLLVNELVTNSIRHAGLEPADPIRITAVVSRGTLRVDVFDGGDGLPVHVAGGIRPDPGPDSGWGLYLVETLSTRWGNARGRYWFELDLEAADDLLAP